MVKTVGDFVTLVAEMRETQKIYFRTRSSYSLNTAKALEKKVDHAIEQWEQSQDEKKLPWLGL